MKPNMRRLMFITFCLCMVFLAKGQNMDTAWTLASFKSEDGKSTSAQSVTYSVANEWPTQIVFTSSTKCICYFGSKAEEGSVDQENKTIQIVYADKVVGYVWKVAEDNKGVELKYELLAGSVTSIPSSKAVYQLQ